MLTLGAAYSSLPLQRGGCLALARRVGDVTELRDRARALRKTMTPQEIRLWGELRNLNRQGHHFRRQAPVDGYILDFAEFRHRLVIEVDGSQHGFAREQAHDARRDRHFETAGFRVLRFWNIDVDTNMDGVVQTILSALRQPPPGASRHPPREGEGKAREERKK